MDVPRLPTARARSSVAALSPVFLWLGACSTPAPLAPSCARDASLDCLSLYDPPVFATLYEKIFHPTCAAGIGSCHSADAVKGGLVFEDPDDAYERLVGARGPSRVSPQDFACSALVVRLESPDPNFRMPPGPTPLLESERCAIRKWITEGALR